MLKFFRNIRRALIQSSSGKPASPVGRYFLYAIGEIILVVIGILIALQINNWNERRKTRDLEIKYLNEVRDEINITKDEIQTDHDNHVVSMRAMIDVRDLIVKKLPPNDSLMNSLGTINSDFQVYPKTAAFDNLKSIGLNIISNDTLRSEIADLYQLRYQRIVDRGDNNPKYDITRKIEPYLYKHLVIDPSLVIGGSTIYGTEEPFDYYWWKISDYDRFLNDLDFVNELQITMGERNQKIAGHYYTIYLIENLSEAIDRELERIE